MSREREILRAAQGKRQGVSFLKVASLGFDPIVNRDVREEWVREIARDFDPAAFGLPLVNVRPGGATIVIDGQHRIKALLLMKWANQQVECEVYRGLTTEEEAAMFLLRNERRNMSHIDKFLKRVVAGNSEALAISDIVRAAGLSVQKSAADGHLTASKALEKVYRGDRFAGVRENPKALADTLGTMVTAWGRSPTALRGELLSGIGLVYLRENGKVDKVALASKLAQVPGGPLGLLGRARGAREIHSKTLPQAIAGVIVDLYNKGRRRDGTTLRSWWPAK